MMIILAQGVVTTLKAKLSPDVGFLRLFPGIELGNFTALLQVCT